MKKLSSLLLAAVVTLNSIPVLGYEGFPDVSADAWYATYVEQAVEEGLMNGYENNTFGPNVALTRGEAAQIIYNWAKNPAVNGTAFPDTAGMWYNNAAQFCKQYGYITGYENGNFGGGDPVSRQQLITILHRIFESQEISQIGGPTNPFDRYPDGNQVADWASKAMYWGIASQLIGSSTYLNPNGNTTRAEASKMLVVWKNIIGEWKGQPVRPGIPAPEVPEQNYTERVQKYLENSGTWFWNGAIDTNIPNLKTMVTSIVFNGHEVTLELYGGEKVTTTFGLTNIQKNGAKYYGLITFASLTIGGVTFAPATAELNLVLSSSQSEYDVWTMIQILFENEQLREMTAHNHFADNGIVQFKDNRDLFTDGESNRPQL